MKLNWKSIGITSVLIVLLCGVIIVELSLFISGPARKYEGQIDDEMARIQEKYKNIKNMDRHVFYYTTYVGEDTKTIVWFNVKGKAIVNRKKNTLKIEEAKQVAQSTYGAKEVEVALGYGYDNPVYVIQSDVGSILLDYDTLKEVYYLKEGDV